MRQNSSSLRFLFPALALASCAPPSDAPTLRPSAPTPAWLTEVSARVRDSGHRFRPGDGGFAAIVHEQGLSAEFSNGGTVIWRGNDGVGVSVLGVGRGDDLDDVSAPPTLGACVDGMNDPSGQCVRRLEVAGPGITGWWVAGEAGFEQGWTVDVRPDGGGPLAIELAVDGATVTRRGDELRLRGEGGSELRVSGLAAWDADGLAIEAAFVPTAEGFRVEVDDTRARYPIEVDPFYSSATWSVSGTTGTDLLGDAIDGAGDVNGDGYGDVILGSTDSDAAYVFLGSATGLSASADITLEGSSGSEFGRAVAGAGDVDADGYDDVIIGDIAAAYVYHGAASGVETTATSSLSGRGYENFGCSVDGAGDVNNDGYDDVVVGEDEANSDVGWVYVFHGSASGVSTSAAFDSIGPLGAGTPKFGHAVAGAGDINGDGYGDIVVGAPDYDTSFVEVGAALVYYGSASGITAWGARTYKGGGARDHYGYSVDGAGDLDGDGYDEIIVGQYASTYGNAYVYAGSATGASASAVSTLTGAASGDELGWDVAGAGDVNNDGYNDVIVGAPGYGTAGRSYVYVGSAGGLSPTVWDQEDGTGMAVAGLGDLNGDGYDEVASGSDAEPTNRGSVVVRDGAAAALGTTTEIDGLSDDELGTLVGSAGDVNGDGYDDVYVTAPGYENYTGMVMIYHGDATGLATTAAVTLNGAGEDRFGCGVGAGGDLNADGYDDLAVAASSGYLYIYLGSSAGIGAASVTPAYGAKAVAIVGDLNGDGYDDVVADNGGYLWTFHGGSGGPSATYTTRLSSYGSTVAPAGDVNGDGFADVLAGYPSYSGSTGEAFVYYGSSSGVTSTGAVTLPGYNTGDYFGAALDGAGDVNADGYDDVLIGGYGYNSRAGRAYVYHGGATGLNTTVKSVVTGTSFYGYLGLGVAGVGDVDGDGYDDIGVTAYRQDTTGEVGIYPGSSSGISSTALATFASAAQSIGGAGDVDGDGALDVILGDPDADGDGGAAYLFQSYFDVDGDGIAASSDCDDTDASIGGPDIAYADLDGDGFGDAGAPAEICAATAGYVSDATDCDDTAASAHPGGTEVCDAANVDEDCDGLSDDADADATGLGTIYADADGDGYGDTATTAAACDAGAGWSSVADDCDDTNAAINPAAIEACDAADVDEDCDGTADDGDTDAAGKVTVYADTDADGYGGASAQFCDAPATGYVATSTDCDDANAGSNPGAAEVCDTGDVDENCDGLVDDVDPTATGQTTFYLDNDSDGFGGAVSTSLCDQPAGYVAESTDYDDSTATINPAATEVCDPGDVDEDCNGLADEADAGVSGTTTVYVDGDGDGYGGSTAVARCEVAAGYAESSTDCDDAGANAHPDATEIPGNEVDDDCDGAELCYADADGDGLRGVDEVSSSDADCDDAGEAAASATPDCDDADAAVGGGREEIVGDGIDEDCDGEEVCFADADGDGFRPDATATTASADPDCTDAGEADASAPLDDCNDADDAFHPGAEEANCADPNDYNCDGSTGTTDGDGDGFAACEECDDARTAVNPGADELCNGRDDDCDGDIDGTALDQEPWYVDADGDGYTDPASAVTACDPPAGYFAATDPDCDDADATVNPGGVEVADDGIDQDCSGADLVSAGEDTGGEVVPGCGGCGTPAAPGSGAIIVAIVGLLALRRRRTPLTTSRGHPTGCRSRRR